MTTAPHTPQTKEATSREMHFYLAGWSGAVMNVDATEHFQKAQASAPQRLAGSGIYGFFHSECIHESAAALVSLHLSKYRAWKAMHSYQWQEWEKARSNHDSNLHLSRYVHKCKRDARTVLRLTKSHVALVEVQP